MKIFWFCILLFLVSLPRYSLASWSGKWDFKGSDATVGLSSDPQNPAIAKNVLLIVGYSKKFNCQPTVSVLIMNGQKLGVPTKQRTFKTKKNQLVLTVGSREFKGETKLTVYTNARELAMWGSQDLVSALNNNNASITAKIDDMKLLEFANATGFELANSRAKINCN